VGGGEIIVTDSRVGAEVGASVTDELFGTGTGLVVPATTSGIKGSMAIADKVGSPLAL